MEQELPPVTPCLQCLSLGGLSEESRGPLRAMRGGLTGTEALP